MTGAPERERLRFVDAAHKPGTPVSGGAAARSGDDRAQPGIMPEEIIGCPAQTACVVVITSCRSFCGFCQGIHSSIFDSSSGMLGCTRKASLERV